MRWEDCKMSTLLRLGGNVFRLVEVFTKPNPRWVSVPWKLLERIEYDPSVYIVEFENNMHIVNISKSRPFVRFVG